jgi:glycosyltransferase A (GT-A) superfamily protein (DUF2064 family)
VFIAAKQVHPELFEGVGMGTSRALAETLARAGDLRVLLLSPHRDLDTAADVRAALCAGELDHAPRTLELLVARR